MRFQGEHVGAVEAEEVLFENTFAMTKAEVRGYTKRTMRNRARILYIFCAMLIFGGVVNFFSEETYPGANLVVSLLYAGLFFAVLKIATYLRIKREWKLFQLRIPRGQDAFTYQSAFYGDRFQTSRVTADYHQITKVLEGKTCLYLVVEKVLIFIVKKDAFIKGDFASLVSFLCEKTKDNPKAQKGLRKIRV